MVLDHGAGRRDSDGLAFFPVKWSLPGRLLPGINEGTLAAELSQPAVDITVKGKMVLAGRGGLASMSQPL